MGPSMSDNTTGYRPAEVIAANLSDQWGDRRDEWSACIDKAHPMNSGAHDAYLKALEMVGNRHSKGALVSLVCWLLQGQPK